jgi:hypothetical protein
MFEVTLTYNTGTFDKFECTPVAASRIMDDWSRSLDNPYSFYCDVTNVSVTKLP